MPNEMVKEKILKKAKLVKLPIDLEKLARVKTFWEFDDLVTAKLFGFSSAKDYYDKSSSFYYLAKIKKDCLILHAYNDPFLPVDAIPSQSGLPTNVKLEVSQQGGHVGFIEGTFPWRAKYWLEKKVPAYIQEQLGIPL